LCRRRFIADMCNDTNLVLIVESIALEKEGIDRGVYSKALAKLLLQLKN
jgi:hypothetical protein